MEGDSGGHDLLDLVLRVADRADDIAQGNEGAAQEVVSVNAEGDEDAVGDVKAYLRVEEEAPGVAVGVEVDDRTDVGCDERPELHRPDASETGPDEHGQDGLPAVI